MIKTIEKGAMKFSYLLLAGSVAVPALLFYAFTQNAVITALIMSLAVCPWALDSLLESYPKTIKWRERRQSAYAVHPVYRQTKASLIDITSKQFIKQLCITALSIAVLTSSVLLWAYALTAA
ncbi:hypothetical protein [Thalassospira alkalitolerans]|uniref:hypothetical protein n=1 Tax=Thalassospira alkalitolerans TaxID=1293890 RepID=UPI003AA8AA48